MVSSDLSGRPFQILLVEDDSGDARLTAEALQRIPLPNQLHIVENGEKALDYLFQRGDFSGSSLPDMVLLDLNLPRVDGHEVLRELKKDPERRAIPVVILSSSTAEEDIARAYNGHANCYVTKPVGWKNFLEAVQSIGIFWFQTVRLAKN